MFFESHFISIFCPSTLSVLRAAVPPRARPDRDCCYVFSGWGQSALGRDHVLGSSVDYICGLALVRLSCLPDVDGCLRDRAQ